MCIRDRGQLYSIATSGELVKLQVNGRRLEYELVMENLSLIHIWYVANRQYRQAHEFIRYFFLNNKI